MLAGTESNEKAGPCERVRGVALLRTDFAPNKDGNENTRRKRKRVNCFALLFRSCFFFSLFFFVILELGHTHTHGTAVRCSLRVRRWLVAMGPSIHDREGVSPIGKNVSRKSYSRGRNSRMPVCEECRTVL